MNAKLERSEDPMAGDRLDLDAIEARLKAATPGPWRVNQHSHAEDQLWLSIGHFTHEGTSSPDGRWIGPVAEIKYLVTREEEQRANAELIAHAPEDIAALLAALRARAVPDPREAAPMSQGLRRSLARHALWLKEFTYGSETYLLGDELERWIGAP